ncbi:hypothetical protein BLA24_21175 [Streptomyces cinnamoneus]|uniref:DUF397 domain-containing protein n=1 Tax=Streptomyces cinnamoneus TaxID=53446 RepID=A0A2G1XGP8_STRCJ|nr:DUF397 domain-containing protein [Streptomyces cinnamoneus]PHQ50402.1 hypothetical protein BLA24_21175 [Streptomyces cinnamoneus]PPT16453.1 DUF397 domain-containing protein [Streptomyces cinnamoneus]
MATRYGWQKSSFSGEGNACLYLAATEAIHLRESDAPNIIITATPRRLRRLISSIKSGALDRPTR